MSDTFDPNTPTESGTETATGAEPVTDTPAPEVGVPTTDPAPDPEVVTTADDNDDLVLDPEPEGAPEVAPSEPGIIPEEERVVPPTAETLVTTDRGEVVEAPNMPDYVYVRAAVNLPGWDLWATEVEEVRAEPAPPPDAPVEEQPVVVAARKREGWIPNNEEGVRAVELGWAEIIEVPEGVEPPGA